MDYREVSEDDLFAPLTFAIMMAAIIVLYEYLFLEGAKKVSESLVGRRIIPGTTASLAELREGKIFPLSEYQKLFSDIRAYISPRENSEEKQIDIDRLLKAGDGIQIICNAIVERACERRETDGAGHYLLMAEKRFIEREKYNELSKQIFNHIQNEFSQENAREFWNLSSPEELYDEIISNANRKADNQDEWHSRYTHWLALKNTLTTSGYQLQLFPIFDHEEFERKVIFCISEKEIDTSKDPRLFSAREYEKDSLKMRLAGGHT